MSTDFIESSESKDFFTLTNAWNGKNISSDGSWDAWSV